jgi:hypothetical protein
MTDRRRVKTLLRIWIAVAAVALVFGYGAFRAKNLVTGPEVTIVSPADGALVESSLVSISGTARNISFLTLNGDKIFTDESGAWNEHVLLSYGYNTVTLKAEDRFGRTIVKTLQLIYK